jgi:hypothetical protein
VAEKLGTLALPHANELSAKAEEWAGAAHATINDHMGHKRFQLNRAKFQNLWQTCDGEMASWSPGNVPAEFAAHFATEEDRPIAKVAEGGSFLGTMDGSTQ